MTQPTPPIPSEKSAPKYYKSSFASLDYAELWRLCSSFRTGCFALWMKFKGSQRPLSQGIPEPVLLSEARCDPKLLEPDILEALQLMVAEVLPLGFCEPIFYRNPKVLLPTSAAAAICRHTNGEVFANLICVRSSIDFKRVVGFVTGYTDHTFFSSGNSKMKFTPNPANCSLYLPDHSLLDIFQIHNTQRAKWGANKSVSPIRNETELESVLSAYEWSGHQWRIDRGAHILMTAEEVEMIRSRHATSTATAPGTLNQLDLELVLIRDDGEDLSAVDQIPLLRKMLPSIWWLSIDSFKGNVNLELMIDSPLLRMKEGLSYEGTLARAKQTNAQVFLSKLQALLGAFDPEGVQACKKCPIELILLKRESGDKVHAPNNINTQSAGPHVFEMKLLGVEGSFELMLDPQNRRAQLLPNPTLDRSAAARVLAGLVKD